MMNEQSLSPTMTDIYWLAGLLEGEGCFSTNGKFHSPRITVGMYDADVITRANRILKPHKYRENGNKPRFDEQRRDRRLPMCRAAIGGRRAAGWMMTLYPLMGVRRQHRIREVLDAWLHQPLLGSGGHNHSRAGESH